MHMHENSDINKISNADRAALLIKMLPYIRRYSGSVVVVKYGGHAMTDENSQKQVMEDLSLLSYIGVKTVLVHGGGPEVNRYSEKLGIRPSFIDGLRVTDKESLDVVQMVLSGKINKNLVKLLCLNGAKAVGVSGIDGRLIRAEARDKKLGFVGDITGVDAGLLEDIMDKNYIPVVSTVAMGDDGATYNINGDTAASAIAVALKADRLLMMTDIEGVLYDRDNPSSIIPEITVAELIKLKNEGIITGGMIPKIDCCIEAVNNGVESAVIMDGRIPHSILMELMTDEGAGTLVRRN